MAIESINHLLAGATEGGNESKPQVHPLTCQSFPLPTSCALCTSRTSRACQDRGDIIRLHQMHDELVLWLSTFSTLTWIPSCCLNDLDGAIFGGIWWYFLGLYTWYIFFKKKTVFRSFWEDVADVFFWNDLLKSIIIMVKCISISVR